MSESTRHVPHASPIPEDKGYLRAEELPDLGVIVYTSRLPYVDVEGYGAMPVMPPSVDVFKAGGTAVLYHRFISGDDSDAALDARHQGVIDRLRTGAIRHDGTHAHIDEMAIKVYRFMEERLSYYERNGEIEDDSLDDPNASPYGTLTITLRDDAYDAYDLWNEDEEDADDDLWRRVARRLATVGITWGLVGWPSTTDWIVRDLAHDIVSRWTERRSAAAERRLPTSMAPHEREQLGLQLLVEEMEARGPQTTVGDVMPTVDARLNDLTARRWARSSKRGV